MGRRDLRPGPGPWDGGALLSKAPRPLPTCLCFPAQSAGAWRCPELSVELSGFQGEAVQGNCKWRLISSPLPGHFCPLALPGDSSHALACATCASGRSPHVAHSQRGKGRRLHQAGDWTVIQHLLRANYSPRPCAYTASLGLPNGSLKPGDCHNLTDRDTRLRTVGNPTTTHETSGRVELHARRILRPPHLTARDPFLMRGWVTSDVTSLPTLLYICGDARGPVWEPPGLWGQTELAGSSSVLRSHRLCDLRRVAGSSLITVKTGNYVGQQYNLMLNKEQVLSNLAPMKGIKNRHRT